MRAITKETRKLIIAAKERGEKERVIALWLNVSVRSVSRIWELYQTTKSVQPKQQPGRKAVITDADLGRIQDAVKRQNDITLDELIESLGLPIKKSRLSEILIDMGLSFKKRRFSQRNN